MNLRPYQNEAKTHALQMIVERGNSLIVAGTGAGKTIMMAACIGEYVTGFKAEKGRMPHVLVLVHRTEIHSQNHSKFSLVCPNIATSEITADRKSLKGYIHFGMVQTVVNLLPELEKTKSYFDLIVIDEAHHAAASTYEDIINWNLKGNPDTAVLGVTATPNRGDKLPLVHLFDNYFQITTKFLIDSHYLVRPRFTDLSPVFEVKDGAEKGHLAKNLSRLSDSEGLLDKLCADYLKFKEPGKSIIFCPNHDFCQKIYDRLKAMGRKPAYLGNGIDDETRRTELEKFENGDSEELINVDICTEGYDYPELRNLVDFDTNGTHGQWVQKVGRVLRTAPGKTKCTVIDFGGNIDLYPDGVDADVLLEGAVKKEKGEKLTSDDLFKKKSEDWESSLIMQDEGEYTPYHLPIGFESVNDKDYGIVFVACGKEKDCIIVKEGDGYVMYYGNKTIITKAYDGEFDEVMKKAVELMGDVEVVDRPISNIQIKLLAPEYPTMALDWHGANCHICWKMWKDDIRKGGI